MGLFDFFKNKNKNKKKIVDPETEDKIFKANNLVDRLLECSTAFSHKPGYYPLSLYVVGYLYGASDGMYQKLFPKVDMIHFMATYNAKLIMYFKEKEALSLAGNLEQLSMGSNEEFSKGMIDGGREIFAWFNENKHPASLELYLNANSKNLNYKSSKKFINNDYKKISKILKDSYKDYKKNKKK